MHTSQYFAESDDETLRGFMRAYPLALVAGSGRDGLVASHVPLVAHWDENGQGILRGHIARANSMCKQVEAGAEVLCVFSGPNHYVSPQWYPSKRRHGRVAPTWNYSSVQVRGRITWHQDAQWLHSLLQVLTASHEKMLPTPWSLSDAPAEYVAGLLREIVGFEIPIASLLGKFKLSQNREPEDRAGVAAGLDNMGTAAATEMAALVRKGRWNAD